MKNITIEEKMITLYRFMSLGEVSALMKGETITRNSPYNGRTTARPTEVCFMTGNPTIYDYRAKSIETIDPLNSLSSLDGVVSTEFLAEIAVPVSRISWGTGYYAEFIMEEVYVESYSSNDVTKVWKNNRPSGWGFEAKDVIEFVKSSRRKEDSTIHQIREKSKKKEEVVKPRVKLGVSTNN